MSIIEQVHEGRLRQVWDSETRTYSRFDWSGVLLAERPFTEAENAFADAAAAAAVRESNRESIVSQLDESMANLQTLLDTAPATINAGPAPYIKLLARVLRQVIRLLLKRLEATS